MKYISQSAAGKKISAFIVLRKNHTIAAKVVFHYGNDVAVNIFTDDGMQHDTNSTDMSAIHGLIIDGHVLRDHSWGLKLPKGKKYFPANYRHKKGYSMANAANFDDKGKRLSSTINHYYNFDRTIYTGIVTRGYDSCFQAPGLDYLKALGYTVIQAL